MGQKVDRAAEIAKYSPAYTKPKYRMGTERRDASERALLEYPANFQCYLDVGAGRSEMLEYAKAIGFAVVEGTEVVAELLQADPRLRYAEAHDLPFEDSTYDVVTCFDVLEHLIPSDVTPAIDELFRVAKSVVIVSAAKDSQLMDGVEHHPSRRPLSAWRQLLIDRALRVGWRFEEARRCRKGSDLWIFSRRGHAAA